MTIRYHNFYLKFILVFLFFWGTQPSLIVAQGAPPQNDSTKTPLLVAKPLPALAEVKSTPILAETDLAKAQSVSFFPKTFKVQKGKLNRKYYNNNIFAIEESDNPFALRVTGNKSIRKTKDKENQSNTEVLSELFSISDQTTSKTPQWLIFVLLGLLSLMSILIAIYRKEVGASFQAFFSTGSARNLHREQESFLKMESFSSYILFVLAMGAYCFLIPQILIEDIQFNTFGALLLSIGGIAAVYLLKHLQLKILAVVLPASQEIDFYNFIISNTNKVLAYLLIPILFLLAYTPDTAQVLVLYGSFGLLGLIYFYRTLKGLASAGSIILLHKFHFFVYLCAVEIAPILILMKLLSIL